MVDTIILMLKQNMFTILEPDRFSPSARRVLDTNYRLGGRANTSCYQNPTPNELRSGIYKPRLTLTRRMRKEGFYEVTLRVELSLPKLIFGNNFDELENEDFFDVIVSLQEKLKGMGIVISEVNLATSLVSGVHYSKNIVLADYSTPYTYIKQLRKANINQNLDTNQTDFRNEGHSWKYRANTFEIVFYDKLKDLQYAGRSRKRAEEKDNEIQLNLFSKETPKDAFEVLRVEIRLNTRQKIRQILRKINRRNEPTFFSLFSQEISKSVLLSYINEIEEAYPSTLTGDVEKSADYFNGLLVKFPGIKLHTALKLTGLKSVLEEIGVREFRHTAKKFGDSAWYALNSLMKEYTDTNDLKPVFPFLKKEINNFKSLKLVDYSDKMLNNDK